jgi:hypothetical protein
MGTDEIKIDNSWKYGTKASKDELIKYVSEIKNKQHTVLLRSKNYVLTTKAFHIQPAKNNPKKESLIYMISDMTMAIVEDDDALGIIFKDSSKMKIKLDVDTGTTLSAVGLILFGGIGDTIAGNMALKNKIKATSQQWSTAINALISKSKLPEMIYCKYCGTKNKSSDPKCVNCGATLA